MLAYGLNVRPMGAHNDLVGRPELTWHDVGVRRRTAPPPTQNATEVGDDSALIAAQGYASLQVSRHDLMIETRSPHAITDDELAHPLLAFAGAVIAAWTGRTAFHGGAVVLQGQVWVLLAGPTGGKSTLVSELNARGHVVLADDLAVVDGRTVLAGPRTCDLREEAAQRLRRGRRLEVEVGRPRFRDQLAPAPHEAPLGGFVSLQWGDDLRVEPADIRHKLELLAVHDALRQGPPRPEAFLQLLPLPTFTLTRPRSWDATAGAISLLEEIAT